MLYALSHPAPLPAILKKAAANLRTPACYPVFSWQVWPQGFSSFVVARA